MVTIENNCNICNLRVAKGMTQQALAMAVGVSRSSVAMWETGQTVPRIENISKLADVLGVDAEFLFLNLLKGIKQ